MGATMHKLFFVFQVASACSGGGGGGSSSSGCSSKTWYCGSGKTISIPRRKISGRCVFDYTSDGLQRYVFDRCVIPSDCRNHKDWKFKNDGSWCTDGHDFLGNGGLIGDHLEAACLSHDQCHSWTGGTFWSHSKFKCDDDQRKNGNLICAYLKNVNKTKCYAKVALKFAAHTVPPASLVSKGFFFSAQLKGCGKFKFFEK